MECSTVRDIKRAAGAGMISKKVSYILPASEFFFPQLLLFQSLFKIKICW